MYVSFEAKNIWRNNRRKKRTYVYTYIPAQNYSKLHIVLYEDSIRDVSWQSLIVADEMETSEVVCDGRLALPSVLTRDVGLNVGEQVIH